VLILTFFLGFLASLGFSTDFGFSSDFGLFAFFSSFLFLLASVRAFKSSNNFLCFCPGVSPDGFTGFLLVDFFFLSFDLSEDFASTFFFSSFGGLTFLGFFFSCFFVLFPLKIFFRLTGSYFFSFYFGYFFGCFGSWYYSFILSSFLIVAILVALRLFLSAASCWK